MDRRLALLVALPFVSLGWGLAGPAQAASLQPVSNWGASGVPSYTSMYVYVPDKVATKPPILVVAHFCGGSASAVFGQASGIVTAADKYGFIMIFPQTTNAATSAKCWEVGSKASLTHDGGGDTQAVAQMVKYAITTYKANPDRVYATGDSSGGMMTQALLAVYPDVFKAGASFAGVAAGCWSSGWSAASNWGGTCADGNDNRTAQQWGDLVRGMYPGYTGPRPRVQLFHGDADSIIKYKNFGESIKEWTNVLGLATSPTSTSTVTLGSHQASRQQWKNSCGAVVLDGFTSMGGDHGPSDALFNAGFVVPSLGLANVGDVDPVVAGCSGDGGVDGGGGTTGAGGAAAGGTGGGTAAGGRGGSNGGAGTQGRGGTTGGGGSASAGTTGAGGTASAGTTGSAGTSATGGTGTTGSAGTSATGGSGTTGSAGTTGASGTTGVAGTTGAGGTTGTGGSEPEAGGCGCSLAAESDHTLAIALGLGLLVARRRRSRR